MDIAQLPGLIPLSRIRAEPTPALLAKLADHVAAWVASVPPGTISTVDKMLNCSPTCGCPDDAVRADCTGPRIGVPLEVVRDVLLPPDGTPTALPGITVHTTLPWTITAVTT